jgi:hypothetical protein
MKPAVIIVDMIRDNVDSDMHSGIKEEATINIYSNFADPSLLKIIKLEDLINEAYPRVSE